MNYLKIFLGIAGSLLITSGVVFVFFLLALNDPEIEGESRRTAIGTYFFSLIPITIGIVFMIISSRLKENKQ